MIDTIACQRALCGPALSSTSRRARLRTAGENLFDVLLMMLQPTQELKPPAIPVRFGPHHPGRAPAPPLIKVASGRRKTLSKRMLRGMAPPSALVRRVPLALVRSCFGRGQSAGQNRQA